MKNPKIFKSILFLGLFFLLSSCEKDPAELLAPDQEVFFQVTHVNYAFGKQASGFFIDSAGAVKTYQGVAKWASDDNKGQLSEIQMKENLALAKDTKKKLVMDLVKKYTASIPNISVANYSKKISGGADRGSFIYYAFTFDGQSKTYKAIKLAEYGDWISINEDINAKTIVLWLKTVQTEAFSK